MYEIKSTNKIIDDIEVSTWTAEITSANILEVEVGTTGYQGGDYGHGGRTYFRIKDLGSTALSANVVKNKFGDTEEVSIELGGDTEMVTFLEALKFAVVNAMMKM